MRQNFIGSLVAALAFSCAGKVLVVAEDDGSSSPDDDGGAAPLSNLPCDIFAARGHACVAAHSTVRRLRSAYTGPLYQLCKGPGSFVPGPGSCIGEAIEVHALGSGYADAKAHAAFCEDEPRTCTITMIYDQSGEGNHVEPAPPGSAKTTPGEPALAMQLPTVVNGRAAYGLKIEPGKGYRGGCLDCTREEPSSEMPIDDEPETIYMVTSNEDLLDGCCFNYGNGSVTANNDGNGTAEAVHFGHGVVWGSGTGAGPWVMADLENGLFAGWERGRDDNISTNTSLLHEFVTAMIVGDTADKNDGQGRFALYGASAQGSDGSASKLTTMYDGIRPEKPGYVPMLKQGSAILGIASDNSNGGGGRFYEGAIVRGAASKKTLDAVQAAILAAKYGN